MAYLKVNGVDLHVEEYGAGAPVLGVHGSPSSTPIWSDAGAQLGAVGRCVLYDRRGYGRSERPEPFDTVDLDDHVADAAEVLRSVDAAPAVVVGRSSGGQIALELALRYPSLVRGLVLLEPLLLSLDPQAAEWGRRLRAAVLDEAESDEALASEALFRFGLGPRLWESFPAGLRELYAVDSPAVLAELRGRGFDLSGEPAVLCPDRLRALDLPVLLVSAADSPAAIRLASDRLAELLPQAERELVPGGHMIHPAHPHVRTFLERLRVFT